MPIGELCPLVLHVLTGEGWGRVNDLPAAHWGTVPSCSACTGEGWGRVNVAGRTLPPCWA